MRINILLRISHCRYLKATITSKTACLRPQHLHCPTTPSLLRTNSPIPFHRPCITKIVASREIILVTGARQGVGKAREVLQWKVKVHIDDRPYLSHLPNQGLLELSLSTATRKDLKQPSKILRTNAGVDVLAIPTHIALKVMPRISKRLCAQGSDIEMFLSIEQVCGPHLIWLAKQP